MSIDDGMPLDMVSIGVNAPYELSIDTREYADGYHTIYVNSIDFTGQESDRECQIFMDNSGPDITIVRPGKFTHRKGTIGWEINATDASNIAGVYVKFDSGDWHTLLFDNYTYNYTFAWRTTEDDNRGYDYEIKTVDTLGNEEVVRGRISVKNDANLWRAFQDNLPGIGFLFLVFFIILCFVLLKVGTLQAWYREEKKAPKSKAQSKKHGKARGIFARKKKGVPKGDIAVVEAADDIVHEFETIDEMKAPAPMTAKLPPPPPPGMGKKSMMESIDDIEINQGEPPAHSNTPDIPKKASSTMEEMKALTTTEPETPKEEKVSFERGKKKVKKRVMRRKEK
jgi:hypothetical protein